MCPCRQLSNADELFLLLSFAFDGACRCLRHSLDSSTTNMRVGGRAGQCSFIRASQQNFRRLVRVNQNWPIGAVATVAAVSRPTKKTGTKRAAKSKAPAPRRPKKRSRRTQQQHQPPEHRPFVENEHAHSLRAALNNDRELVRQFCAQTGDRDERIRICRREYVKRGSVYFLRPREWLNDELINYFGALVSNRDDQLSLDDRSRKKSAILTTYFYSKLMGNDEIYSYDSVARWPRMSTSSSWIKSWSQSTITSCIGL